MSLSSSRRQAAATPVRFPDGNLENASRTLGSISGSNTRFACLATRGVAGVSTRSNPQSRIFAAIVKSKKQMDSAFLKELDDSAQVQLPSTLADVALGTSDYGGSEVDAASESDGGSIAGSRAGSAAGSRAGSVAGFRAGSASGASRATTPKKPSRSRRNNDKWANLFPEERRRLEARRKRKMALVLARHERMQVWGNKLVQRLRERLSKIYPEHLVGFHTVRTRILKVHSLFKRFASGDGTVSISDLLDSDAAPQAALPYKLPMERLEVWRGHRLTFFGFVHALHPKLSTAYLDYLVQASTSDLATVQHMAHPIPAVDVDRQGVDELKKLWRVYIRGGTSKLSCASLADQLKGSGLSRKDLHDLLIVYDSDNDGSLCLDEFLAMMASTGVWGAMERQRLEDEARHARDREQDLSSTQPLKQRATPPKLLGKGK